MGKLTRILLAFASGAALCAGLWMSVEESVQPPARPLGAVPRHTESVRVLMWLQDNRADFNDLHFVVWWQPLEVEKNPVTGGPATLVHVIFQRAGTELGDGLEDWSFYVRNDQVLGGLRNGQGGAPNPRGGPPARHALVPARL